TREELITHLQRSLEHIDHLAWKILGPARRVFCHRMRTPQRMRHALLVHGTNKAIIGREAIVRQVTGPGDADGFFQDVSTAAWVDGETGGPVASDPSVEPDGLASESPTGFVGCEVLRVADVLFDFFVNGLESPTGSQD